MIIECQTCGQKLPKTAVMCPNCGGRSFLPVSHEAQNNYQSTLANQNFNPANSQQPSQNYSDSQANSWTQNPVTSNQTDAAQLNNYPSSQPNYQPPQDYNYQNYQQQPYQSPNDLYAQTTAPSVTPVSYPAPEAQPAFAQLPSTALQTRKPAYTMLYAGFIRRGFAYLFDLILVGLLLGLGYQLALPQVLPQLGIRGLDDQTLGMIAMGFYLFYMAFFSCLGRQATIGKVIMGMWVFGMQGQRINFFQALFREALKLFLLPFAFLMWFTARKQTLHDLIARTVVLFDPN